MWNNIAYQLSLKQVELERALRYAESAVSATTAASRNMTVKDVTVRELAVTSSLANYWDTLGWVHFATGDLTRAEPLVLAAWQLAQHSEVGDHLGQIYEKQGRREEALRAYALSLASESPTDEIRARFTKLAGGKAASDVLIGKHKDGLADMRTHALRVKSPAEGSADFFILVGAKGVEEVRFIKGDEPLKPLAEALRTLALAGAVPPDSDARIVRRATVTCGGSSTSKNRTCTARLDPADTVKTD
jgi:tetratricopeptide (TPR) repeat protein